ncbi:hypothetical protein AMATHDRAFT_156523 [Amanita thiersii Skay4041]|uniref:Chromatin modification-related protein n=1 Tax=Amanita thiersii Skay4041 TaxID=703135 RepID=A0A2A9NCV1_9AGAR|nr:hypothetical protein AMATHDRAFT_156523 [Amanita thiersii Skay4041]
MSNPTQNLEEAATLASEFIYSIDNLPNEVQFLLAEIKHKEIKAQEIQQEIDKDTVRYIRHTLRSSSNSNPNGSLTTPTSATTPSSSLPSPPNGAPPISTPNPNQNPTNSPLPLKIASSYKTLHAISTQKHVLAQQLIDLLTRTRARLDHDIARVRILQGESPEYVAATMAAAAKAASSAGLGVGDGYHHGLGLKNPALQISESLRNALRASPGIGAGGGAGVGGGTGGGAGSTGGLDSAAASPAGSTKRRRLAPTASIKLTTGSLSTPTRQQLHRRSASPATTSHTHPHAHGRSRLSRRVLPPEDESEEEEEEEEEEAPATATVEEDDKIYCFCQKKSFGDMIACDNEGNCPYEWFHLSCVGLKQPTPEKWYCSVCTASLTKGSTTSTRKGRKK